MAPDLENGDLLAAVGLYRTCELATTSRSGSPLAVPVSVAFDAERGLVTVGTSLGLLPRAADARRDPHVALLFSDPAGGGRPEILVQGRATSPAEPVTPAGPEEPRPPVPGSGTGASRPGVAVPRRMTQWYQRQVVLTIVPTSVRGRPAARPVRLPAGSTPPTVPVRDADGAFADAARRLAAFDSAVLAAHDGTGAPWLLRVDPVPDRATETFLVEVPPGEPVRPGPASLLAYRPDERLWRLRSVVLLGDLARTGGRWVFSPHRMVPGADAGLLAAVAVQEGRRAVRRPVGRRPLRPVPWGGLATVVAGTARRAASRVGASA